MPHLYDREIVTDLVKQGRGEVERVYLLGEGGKIEDSIL